MAKIFLNEDSPKIIATACGNMQRGVQSIRLDVNLTYIRLNASHYS